MQPLMMAHYLYLLSFQRLSKSGFLRSTLHSGSKFAIFSMIDGKPFVVTTHAHTVLFLFLILQK